MSRKNGGGGFIYRPNRVLQIIDFILTVIWAVLLESLITPIPYITLYMPDWLVVCILLVYINFRIFFWRFILAKFDNSF